MDHTFHRTSSWWCPARDPRILSLIRRWLKAGVMEEGQVQESHLGTPQGGPISVLISNIYLHYVLDLWIEKVVKPRLEGEVYYVRYLDDFVLCFQYHRDAARFQRILPQRLAKFSLQLEPTKTQLVEFGRFARKWAKLKRKRVQSIYFLGFTLYCGTNLQGNFRVGMKTEKSRLRRSMAKLKELLRKIRHLPLKVQFQSIQRFLKGHYRYYGMCGNSRSLWRIHRFVLKYWKKTLSSRSQKGWVNWEKYKKILKAFPIQEPKIYITHKDVARMALL